MAVIQSMVGRSSYYPCPASRTRMIPVSPMVIVICLLASLAEESIGAEASRRSDTLPEQTFRVRFHEGLLSLEARETPWKRVLTAIQQTTGVRFHPALSLTGSVSVSIPALPVMQALKHLFGPSAGFICRYPAGAYDKAALPREVWILGQVAQEGAASLTDDKFGILPAPQKPASLLPGPATEDHAKASASQEAEVIQYLTSMAQDEDPGIRVQALYALGRKDKGEAVEIQSALQAALDDEDPTVRGAAVQALASRGGPKAMGRLRQALQDPDPGVQLLALDSLASGQAAGQLLGSSGSE